MCHPCVKGILDSDFNKAVMDKYQIFKKLPQISHIHKNLNIKKYDWKLIDQLLLHYKVYGSDVRGIYCFIFASLHTLLGKYLGHYAGEFEQNCMIPERNIELFDKKWLTIFF